MSDSPQTQKASAKPKGLGRGLGSLLGQSNEGSFAKSLPEPSEAQAAAQLKAPVAEAAKAPVVPDHLRIWQVPIEKITPNPNQPRQHFEKEPLRDLSDSIREKGVIQPILLRKTEAGEYEIIAGERRWRAAQQAGLKEIPALVRVSDDRDMHELALIENIQRENLNAVEEAEAYEFLIKKFNLTQQDLAQKMGKDRATIANLLRILQLQPSVRQMVSRGELSLGQAKVLLSIADPRRQGELALKTYKEALSVRALEKLAARVKGSDEGTAKVDARTQAAQALGEELQKLIGSKVALEYTRGKGRIVINFYSDAELNQIADTLRDSWRS